GNRLLVDPAPRPGARLRQAGCWRRVRDRAVAGGAAGDRARARRRDAGASLSLTARRVAFLGPAGTFTDAAMRASAPEAVVGAAGATAEAVRMVAASAEPWAGIGSRLAAELYGAVALAEGVEDHPGNETRFVWLAPDGFEPWAEPNKTSIVFWGFNDISPGAL